MDTGGPRGKAKSDINVTPLIDIVLVLLIVFIVLLPGLTRSLPVAVPQVVRVAADPRQPPLVVTLDAQGGLALQSSPVALAGLARALVPVVRLQPAGQRRVQLRADGEQTWQRVVDVLDTIRLASEQARRETAARPGSGGRDGGDIKVILTLPGPPARR